MDIWAIVPVKSLKDSKRRLAHLLSADERAALIKGLLSQVLATLKEVAAIDHILVVSGDPDVWLIARQNQIAVFEEPASVGLNVAVRRGVQAVRDAGGTAVLVLPVDLPYMTAAAVESFLSTALVKSGDEQWPVQVNGSSSARQGLRLMAICPDESGDGTNALFLQNWSEFSFQYGPGSCQAHLQEGQKRGLTTKVIAIPQLQFDLDGEDDWYAYQSSTVLDY